MEWRHKIDDDSLNIVSSNEHCVIDVRVNTQNHCYEVCVMKVGRSIAFVVGKGSRESCLRTARKLALYPKQALAFAGIS